MFVRYKRKSVLISLSLLILSGLVFPGQGLAAAPSWVRKPPQDRDALAVVGVATAKTVELGQRAALLNAATQVSEYLGITVGNTGTKIRSEVEQRLAEELQFSSGQVPLRGALIREWYFEEVPGGYQVFVLVRYPRAELEKTKSRLQAEQSEQITRARMGIRQGDAAWKTGAFMEALKAFSQAIQASKEADYRALELDARNRTLSLLQSIEMSIDSGDGQVVQPGGRLQAPLVVRVASRLEGEGVPVEGVPVRFSWEDGLEKTKISVLTDSHGQARFNLDQHMAGLSVGVHRIVAALDQESLFRWVVGPTNTGEHVNMAEIGWVEVPGVIFTLKVVPMPRSTRVLLIVEESNVGHVSRESIVMQTLSEALQQAGFRVVADHEIGRTNIKRLQEALRKQQLWPIRAELQQEADLVLAGTASTRKGSDNLGLVISSHADVFIRAVDLESGEVVAQKNLVGLPGFGDTLEMAGIRALQEAGRIVAKALVDQLVLAEEAKTNGKP